MFPGRLGKLCGWALQGYSAVGHCRDTLPNGWAWWLGTAGILCGWALQGYSAVRHCRDTWWLGTAGILCGWALQGYSATGHCRTLPFSTAVRLLVEGEDNIDVKIYQPHSEGGEQTGTLNTKRWGYWGFT